jgi:hypothetical protein
MLEPVGPPLYAEVSASCKTDGFTIESRELRVFIPHDQTSRQAASLDTTGTILSLPKGAETFLHQLTPDAGYAAWAGPVGNQTVDEGDRKTSATHFVTYGLSGRPQRIKRFRKA